MAYTLESITMCEDMSPEGMARITQVWTDIASGRIPLIMDSDGNPREHISPITKYPTWSLEDPAAKTEFTIMAVGPEFWSEMAERDDYVRYEASGADVNEAATKAWERVGKDESEGKFRICHTDDYESTVPPAYTKDGKWNCILYVHVER